MVNKVYKELSSSNYMNHSKLSNITQKWVDILKPFTSDYSAKFSASEIGRLSNIPQQTVSRILIKMVDLNLIEFKIDGKNKYYYFNLEKNNTLLLLNIVEQKKTIDFNLNKAQISLIIEEILSFCDSVIIFGSYSKYGENKNSDLDLIIINGNHIEIKKIVKKYTIEINYENIKYADLIKSIKEKKSLYFEIKNNHIFYGDISKLVKIFI